MYKRQTLAIPSALTVVAVEWTFMQKLLPTTSLSSGEWLASLGLALLVPITIELSKLVRRRRLAHEQAPGQDPSRSRL